MRQFEKTQIICSVNIIFNKLGAELIGNIEKGFDTENKSRYFKNFFILGSKLKVIKK
jgi:hypothetical protein